jgi:predicted PurR-regulated permease PerM
MRALNSYSAETTRWVMIAVAVVVFLAIMWAIRSILLLTLASIILVIFFTIPVRFLSRFGVRRTPAVLLSIFATLALIFLLARVALPTLATQFTTLTTETIPNGARELVNQINSGELFANSPFLYELLQPFIDEFRIDTDLLNEISRQLVNSIGQIGVSVLPVVGDVASTALSVLIVVFLSLYFLIDPRGYTEGFIRLFPLSYRDRIDFIIGRINYTLRRWLEGTFLSMIFVGIGTWIGLSILQLREAAALGVLAGVLSFVPNFGQLVAVIAAIVVGVVQAPENLVWIIIVIYGMSFIQSQIFSPLLFSESIKLPPVMVLLGQIISGALFGFLGILLAVPISAVLLILIQEVYIKDILGDRQVRQTDAVRITEFNDDLLPDGS